jgi:CheY-like chemotaxis protein
MGAANIINIDASAMPQTILVVEDEVMIRLDVADFLRDAGFHVIEAAHAAEALAILRSAIRIDLLFTDIQMPGGMDGLELARWAKSQRPGISILIASGRVGDAALSPDLADIAPIIPKPYAERPLLDRIRQRLGLAPKD